jgi:hypothetical protein
MRSHQTEVTLYIVQPPTLSVMRSRHQTEVTLYIVQPPTISLYVQPDGGLLEAETVSC